MKRVAVSVVAVAALLGARFHSKDHAAKEVRQHLTGLCNGDARCTQAVATHFQACFDQSYKPGGRRQSARLEPGQLVQCINSRAGREHFAYRGEPQEIR